MIPHHLHEAIALEAFAAGKHVLLEKPLATDVATCRRILAAAETSGVVFAVAENAQFIPDVLKAKELLDAGAIGAFTSADPTQRHAICTHASLLCSQKKSECCGDNTLCPARAICTHASLLCSQKKSGCFGGNTLCPARAICAHASLLCSQKKSGCFGGNTLCAASRRAAGDVYFVRANLWESSVDSEFAGGFAQGWRNDPTRAGGGNTIDGGTHW
eukprot:SAG11_NODE_413_length_9694_cov_2.695675_4_plen_216_part_00